MGLDRVEIYRKKRLLDTTPQWRWRYVVAGNNARLANGGEAYGDLKDCVVGAARVVGFDVHSELNWDFVGATGNTSFYRVDRAGGTKIEIRVTH